MSMYRTVTKRGVAHSNQIPNKVIPKEEDSNQPNKMSELSKLGIYFDELNTLRVLEPEIAAQTNDLSDECQVYVEKISEFYKIADAFVSTIQILAETVEKEKLKAIGARNLLQSMSKQRENEQQQLQAQIMEKALELDRLKIELHSLQAVEIERQEMLDHLLQYK